MFTFSYSTVFFAVVLALLTTLARAQDEVAATPAEQQVTSVNDNSAPTEDKSTMTINERVSHLVEIAQSHLNLAFSIFTIVMGANGALVAFAAQQLIEKAPGRLCHGTQFRLTPDGSSWAGTCRVSAFVLLNNSEYRVGPGVISG